MVLTTHVILIYCNMTLNMLTKHLLSKATPNISTNKVAAKTTCIKHIQIVKACVFIRYKLSTSLIDVV